MMVKRTLIVLLIAVILSLQVLGADNPPGTWRGYVTLGGSTAPDGTVIEAFVNSASTPTAIVHAGSEGIGYYIIGVSASTGDTISFKINGIAVTGANSSAQPWSFGLHAVGDSPYFNLSASKASDSASCTYGIGCTGGYCCSSSYEDCSGTCTGGTCQSSACVAPTVTTPPSGGGGGGGAVTAETSVLTSLESGGTGTFTYSRGDTTGITRIDVQVGSAVSNPSISVQESTQPTGASLVIKSSDGEIYKYIEIFKRNFKDSDITKAVITFKVPKSWFQSTGSLPGDIKMARLEGSSWNTLPTTKTSEDENYYYFEAISPGFSRFVIFSQKSKPAALTGQVVAPPASEQPPAVQPPASDQPPSPQPETPPTPTKKNPLAAMLIVAVLVAISLVLAMVMLTKQRPSRPLQPKPTVPKKNAEELEIEELEKRAFRKRP